MIVRDFNIFRTGNVKGRLRQIILTHKLELLAVAIYL